MRFTSILKSMIVEQSRFEILFDALTKPSKDKDGKKVKPKLSKEEFLTLVQGDPTTKTNDVDFETAGPKELANVKAGKYVQWLIKNYLNPEVESQPGDYTYEREVNAAKARFMEDLYKVTEDLTKFERFKSRVPAELRDINKLNPKTLYDAVKDFDVTLATTTKAERKSAPVHPGAKMVYDSPNLRVVEISDKGPAGKEAACFYGGNQKETRWCTSAPGLSHFDYYIGKGPLYVIYDPSDPNVTENTGLPIERWQLNFETDSYMDRHDHSINLIEKLNGPWKELKQMFKSKFAKGLTVGGSKLNIDSFTSGNVGKFIALYGLDELFASLPDTLEEFQIQNRDNNNNIILKIPESISRFKDLHMVLLDNCVEEIPDSICKLPKLRFLALINNPKLKTIPACLANVDTLFFVNLKGSPNVKLPEAIKNKATDFGGGMYDLHK